MVCRAPGRCCRACRLSPLVAAARQRNIVPRRSLGVCACRRRPALRARQLFDAPALGGASESEQTAAAISPDDSEVAQTMQARRSACARPHSRASDRLPPHTRCTPGAGHVICARPPCTGPAGGCRERNVSHW